MVTMNDHKCERCIAHLNMERKAEYVSLNAYGEYEYLCAMHARQELGFGEVAKLIYHTKEIKEPENE